MHEVLCNYVHVDACIVCPQFSFRLLLMDLCVKKYEFAETNVTTGIYSYLVKRRKLSVQKHKTYLERIIF